MKPDPRYVRAFRRLFYRMLHSRRAPHQVTARHSGLRFRFPSNHEVAEALYANAYGRIERTILDSVLVPGMTVVDVGANLGYYACLFAGKVGPQGRVLAIEPTPSSFRLLQENVRLNDLDGMVECLNCALADREGAFPMHVFAEGEECFNSLGVEQTYDGRRAVGTVDVFASTLDKLLAGRTLRRGCFIKIDVEGFEHQVLLGGRAHLRDLEDIALMVELYEGAARQCGSSIRESIALLEDCGFKAYQTTDKAELKPLEKDFEHQPLRIGFFPDVFFFKKAPRLSWFSKARIVHTI